MASKTVKRISCNIVINKVLSFIQNKIVTMDEVSLVKICETAFSPEEIFIAKKLLFDSVQSQKIKNRKMDKLKKDLEDIIDLFKQTDASDPEKLPIFVAKDLHRLPPVTFDHLDAARLLREIQLLQEDVRALKNDCVTQEQLKSIMKPSTPRSHLNVDSNNVNTRRGAYLLNSFNCDSGPKKKRCREGRKNIRTIMCFR